MILAAIVSAPNSYPKNCLRVVSAMLFLTLYKVACRMENNSLQGKLAVGSTSVLAQLTSWNSFVRYLTVILEVISSSLFQ